MSFHNLFKNVRIDPALINTAAAATDENSTGFDMAGYEGIAFVAELGAISTGANVNLHAEMSTAVGGTYVDVKDSAAYFTSTQYDTTGVFLITDVYRPAKQFVRCYLDKADANSVTMGALAYRYRAVDLPVGETTKSSDIRDITFVYNGTSGSATG